MAQAQLDMFGEGPEVEPGPVVFTPDPDRIRRRISRIVDEMRAAESMPWDRNRQRLYVKIVPQMAGALPADEAAELCGAFDRELERLGG